MFFSMIVALTAATVSTGDANPAKGYTHTAAVEKRAEAEEEKLRCKSFRVTGSRIKRERICLTQDGWRKYEEDQRRHAGQITGQGGVCTGGECAGT